MQQLIDRLNDDEVLTLSSSESNNLLAYMEDNDIEVEDYMMGKVSGGVEVWLA